MRVTFVALLLLLLVAPQPPHRGVAAWAPSSTGTIPPAANLNRPGQGFLYGRVTTFDGSTHLGRLRFGRDEEAFWGDYFNGVKQQNPWRGHAEAIGLVQKRRSFSIFGFEIPFGTDSVDLRRPFMARFGDIARIEAQGRDLRVTLKSGTGFDIKWGGANDLDDGVRVWDDKKGIVDLSHWAGGLPPASRVRIRTIELLPTPSLVAPPPRLHGTVRTPHGTFSGFIQWNRLSGVATDELAGQSTEGLVRVRFDTIRAIERRSGDSSFVILSDGRRIVLSGTRDVGDGSLGIYVDDRRYGRVLVSWDAFERIDFSLADNSGPAYMDFPQGSPLMGTVTTRAGQRLAGRLVYDLDESETTETLDAPSRGVNYTIPFGLVSSVEPAGAGAARASVTLRNGEALELERAGDLGAANAGLLVFVEGRKRPEYVPWAEIVRVDFDRPTGDGRKAF